VILLATIRVIPTVLVSRGSGPRNGIFLNGPNIVSE